MAVSDEQIKYILSLYPDAAGNNTEFCLRFWETAAQQRGEEFPEALKAIIRDFKPEAVVRKRREFVPSTRGQRKKENDYRTKYTR